MNDVIFDEEMFNDDQLQAVARRLMVTPAYDKERGNLHVRIYRERLTPTNKQKALFAIVTQDLARQIVLTDGGDYVHARDYDGSVGIKWLTDEQYRGIFAAVICGIDSVPNPEEVGSQIMLLKSTKKLSRRQLSDATTAAMAFGDQRNVTWTPPKTKEPQE